MKYLRFGELPYWGERSINWGYLNFDQRGDVAYMIQNGADVPEKVKLLCEYFRSWRRVDPEKVFENGVSVFRASSALLPVIENKDQATSLLIRIDAPCYLVSGDEIGSGADGEPLLVNVTAEPITLDKSELLRICSAWLNENEITYLKGI